MSKNTQYKDEVLMYQLSRGNLRYAGDLFERYNVKLYNFFLYQGISEMISEDLVQSVFERLLRYRKSYQKEMSFRSWIYQIARNVKADHFKKSKLKISDFKEVDDLNIKDDFKESFEKEQRLQALEQALERISPENRELILLTRFQKLKYREVAEILSISEGAVKVKVHRAIKQLRLQYLKMEQL